MEIADISISGNFQSTEFPLDLGLLPNLSAYVEVNWKIFKTPFHLWSTVQIYHLLLRSFLFYSVF